MVTIEADEEVWRELTLRKNPGDSFNDVLRRVLGLDDAPGDESSQRASTPRESGGVSQAGAGEVPPAIDAAIGEWVPDGEVATETARTALREAVAWLANHSGPAMKGAIVAGAKPAGDTEQTWWERSARPGLAMLAARGLVERPTSKTYELKTDE